jgi:hypothetical protein
MPESGRNCPDDWVMNAYGRCHETGWTLADSLIGQLIVFVDPLPGSRDSVYAKLGPPLGRTIVPPDSMSTDTVVVWHYSGLALEFGVAPGGVNDVLCGVTLSKDTSAIPAVVRIGMPAARVMEIFGATESLSTGDTTVFSYPSPFLGPDESINFLTVADRVTSVRWYLYCG